MKKVISILAYALLAFIVFLPIAVILFSCLGYTFRLTNYSLFAFITALLAVSTFALSVKTKEFIQNTSVPVLLALATPLSLINAVFYILDCGTALVITSMLICVCCCCYLTIKHGKPLALKITCLVLSALMLLPIGFLSFMALAFGDLGENIVVQTVKSPNGAYYAEVINSDQGALGGDTLVDVTENKKFDALIFTISKKSKRVYHGEWGEFEDMEIYWKNENCLVINSVEYMIE